jgi:hypothetical protein
MILKPFGARVATLLLVLAGSACSSASPTGPSDSLTRSRLTQELRSQGVGVAESGVQPAAAFPFFSTQAFALTLNGDNVHVFEYATRALAATDASKVAPAGSPIGTTQVTWVSPPRFYSRDTLIVLYVGRETAVIRALEGVLGPPFAGQK